MHSHPSFNGHEPPRLFWPVLLALAWAVPAGVPAQTAPAAPGLTRPGANAPRQIAASSAILSTSTSPKPQMLLAQVQPADNAGAVALPSAEPSTTSPTYLRDILPIIMRRCSRCHNEQARFVYNWLDYKTASKDRGEIARRVWNSWEGTYFKEAMPIANSPESLAISTEERARIKDWARAGAPQGVPPPPGAAKTRAERMELGHQLFTSLCAACHQPTGRGVPNVFPPLAGSDYLNADKNRAIKTVINGRQGEIVVNGQRFNNSMPKFPLTDEDIASALTYVYNSFGNSGVEVTPGEVGFLRTQPPDVQGPSAPAPKSQFE